MEDIKREIKEAGEIVFEDSPNELISYANTSRLSIATEEVVILFGLRDTDNPTKAKNIAKIYLSLPHTKRIASVLAILIKNYEAEYGEIEADPAARSEQVRKKQKEEVKQEGKPNE